LSLTGLSQLEKHVREHAGDTEAAWKESGLTPGLQIWRVEKFSVVDWPKDRHGSFYDGDSYIVLHVRCLILWRVLC
jgi:gelsolin